MGLTDDLNTLESELQLKFEQHNASVREYNSVRLSFPNDLFSWFGGFGVAEYLDGNESMETETKNTKVRPAVDPSKVGNPRKGMKFRDTKDDTLWKIVDVENGRVGYSKIPIGGGGTITIEHWKECIAGGRYQVE